MKWIIDTDPGVDDAAAIMAAERHLDVLAWSIVHGNVDLDQALQNALFLKDLLGTSTPVYAGAEAPLLEKRRSAGSVHGRDGLGAIERNEPRAREEKKHGVDMIREAGQKYPGELGLLTLGPLTNIALAVAADRELVKKISRVVIMGGTSRAQGNNTVVGEFNFAADPEAAALILKSGLPLTLIPWEPTVDIIFPLEELEKELGTGPVAGVFLEMCRPFARFIEQKMGVRGVILSDLVAAAVAIDPRIMLRVEQLFAAVETAGFWGRGLTAIDYAGVSGEKPQVEICLEADRSGIFAILKEAITGDPGAGGAGKRP